MPALQIQNLSCIRGQKQLFQSINFFLEPGEICQVTGVNGSGKTTLMRMVCGLADAEEGSVFWNGRKIAHCREEYHDNLLYIGHKTGVNVHLTALENLNAWMELKGGAIQPSEVDNALIKVGLFGREDIPVLRLSAGQQRRVALARLLVSKAKLWILDEPFTSIDAKGVKVMQQWFADHIRRGGMILFTSHQLVDESLLTLKTVLLGDE